MTLGKAAHGEPAFVIAGEPDDEDGTLYWSNDDGWGHLSTATVFTDYERAVDHLPVNFSLDQPPRWVQLPDTADASIARQHQLAQEIIGLNDHGSTDEAYDALERVAELAIELAKLVLNKPTGGEQ